MRVVNFVGKEVEIVPNRGGLVKKGVVVGLTADHAILFDQSKEEEVTVILKGETIRLTEDQVIADIEKRLPFNIKPHGKLLLKEILPIYKNMLNT